MKSEKSIEVLNSLIEINNDRIGGYEKAVEETEEQDLKILFAKLGNTSEQCKRELVTEVKQLGGEPKQGTKTSGKFFRAWMDVKAAITGKDRKAILSSCEFGEDVAVKTYEKALHDSRYLTSNQIRKIESQFDLIKADHDKVKSLRDELQAV